MKPQILSVNGPDGKPHAFLVDLDSVFVKNEDGRQRTHYATAVDLRACMAGKIETTPPDEHGVMRIIAPNPCVLAVRKKMKEIGLAARGIHPQAAEVMLRLAASVMNVQVPFNGSMTWTFGKPIQRTDDPDVMAGATPAKLIAAWKWSHWEANRVSGDMRHDEMRHIGYRGTDAALRNLLSDLGLVATRKR